MNRRQIVELILEERERHFNLPGLELDVANSPNDWVAIVGKYLYEETRRGGMKPSRSNFEDSLIKAAAVIIAALEHCPDMERKDFFQ